MGRKKQYIPRSFSTSRKWLYKKVHNDSGLTLYTKSLWIKKQMIWTPETIEYKEINPIWKYRAKRTEVEHIIPAEWMFKRDGKYRCVFLEAKYLNKDPRKWLLKHDEEFNRAHNDLVNLAVVVGSINGMRSRKPFSDKISGEIEYIVKDGTDDIIITSRVVVPPVYCRGHIGRVALYMQKHYHVRYSKRMQSLFERWSNIYPPTKEEINIDNIIYQLQGQSLFK